MFKFQNVVIIFIAICISFLLLDAGLKYNRESNKYGQIIQECERKKIGCEYWYFNEQGEFKDKFDTAYRTSEYRMKNQRLFVIIPFVILIVLLFVNFAVEKNEAAVSVISLSPLFLNFLLNYFFYPEFFMTPIYLFFTITGSYFISRLKRYLIVKKP